MFSETLSKNLLVYNQTSTYSKYRKISILIVFIIIIIINDLTPCERYNTRLREITLKIDFKNQSDYQQLTQILEEPDFNIATSIKL